MILQLTRSAESAAKAHALRGNLPKAYRILRQLLLRPEAVGPTAIRWHRLAASLCTQMSHFDRAVKHLKRAFRCDPSNRGLALRIAKWHDADGDKRKARIWRKKAGVQVKPRSIVRTFLRIAPATPNLRLV